MVLVQAGTVLTESLIGRLKALGVTSVVVAGPDGPGQDQPVEEVLQELDHRFRGFEEDELMMGIRQLARAELGGGGN
jgi:hypothetical protein